MIIQSRHHFLIYPLVKYYGLWLVKRHFQKVVLKGIFQDKKNPILLIANHIGWWDGFWVLYFIQQIIPKRKFCYMMLEEQLRKYFMFRYAGGFSIQKKSHTVVESLNHANELLKNPNNAVLLFPQGEINSLYNSSFRFEKGIEKILQHAKNTPIQILFIANMIDYHSNPKCELTIYFEEYQATDFSLQEIEKSYQDFYQKSLIEQIKKV